MNNFNDEMMKALMVLDVTYPLVKGFDPATFQSMLGCLIDAYAKNKDMTPTETFAILESLADVQKQVHELLGA